MHSSTWTFLELLQFFGPKIVFAILCGGLVGLERELKNKPAGIKTNILICLGAALYSSISVLISTTLDGHTGDPGRLAAQVVSGIGFLGGGAIIQARGTVMGLTTAATIWCVAALGVCIGIGHSDIAVVTAISIVFVLVLSNLFEDRVLGRTLTFATEIVVMDPNGDVRVAINQSLAQNNLTLDDFHIDGRGDLSVLRCNYSGHRQDQKAFLVQLWSIRGIKEVRQL